MIPNSGLQWKVNHARASTDAVGYCRSGDRPAATLSYRYHSCTPHCLSLSVIPTPCRQCDNFRRFFRRCPGRPLEERLHPDGPAAADDSGDWAPADSAAEGLVGGGGVSSLWGWGGEGAGAERRRAMAAPGGEDADPLDLLHQLAPGLNLLGRLLSPGGLLAPPPAPPPPPPPQPLWRSLLGLRAPPGPEPPRTEPLEGWGSGGWGNGGGGGDWGAGDGAPADQAAFEERYQRRYGDRNRA